MLMRIFLLGPLIEIRLRLANRFESFLALSHLLLLLGLFLCLGALVHSRLQCAKRVLGGRVREILGPVSAVLHLHRQLWKNLGELLAAAYPALKEPTRPLHGS